MINLVDAKCEEKKCSVWPIFGYEKGKPMFCKSHRKNDMFDVVDKLCVYNGCGVWAYYNFEGTKIG